MKEGNYKSSSNGMLMQWQIYTSKNNRLYTKTTDSEIAFWSDASINYNPVLSFEINKGVTEILGYQCDELILNCKNGVQKYYFSPKLGVDITLFEKHKIANWYDFLEHSKSLALKNSAENNKLLLTMEMVATKVEKIKLKDSEFELPKGIKTQKAPQ